MPQRKSANGRPSGTDGSDFSYRMVVDSRYTKVAQGKSRLSKLILIQAVILLVGTSRIFPLTLREASIDKISVLAASIGFMSLIIGELGLRRSHANFLKVYVLASSIGLLMGIPCVFKSNLSVQTLQDLSTWETTNVEPFKITGVLIGMLVQIFSVRITLSLVHNMSPPRRAS